jgi:hypothetical protein
MAGEHIVKSISSKSRDMTRENCKDIITILHQNIYSLRNKTTELEIWLDTEFNQVDVRAICLTEHWLNYQNLNRTNILNFKLVNAFNRTCKLHGGSCIYVKDSILTKVIDYFTTPWRRNKF